MKNKGIVIVPGQLLTLGGALTSRIEWFWRQSKGSVFFDKQLAHDSVWHMVNYLMGQFYDSIKDKEDPFKLIATKQSA